MSILDSSNVSSAPVGPTITRYGLIGGMILIVYSLLGNTIGFSRPSAGFTSLIITGLISIAVYVVLIVMAVRQYRDRENGGAITFGKAFLIGLGVAVIIAALSGIFSFLYISIIEPDFLETTMGDMEELYGSLGMSEEQIEQAMEQVRNSLTPGRMILQSLISGLGFGSVISAIIAAIMKRNPEPQVLD